MKEYKLKINGNDYNVVINDVQESPQPPLPLYRQPLPSPQQLPLLQPAVQPYPLPFPALSWKCA